MSWQGCWRRLGGGWAAAYLAQRLFRHKTAKGSYQLVFWMIVLAHQAVAADYLSGGLGDDVYYVDNSADKGLSDLLGEQGEAGAHLSNGRSELRCSRVDASLGLEGDLHVRGHGPLHRA